MALADTHTLVSFSSGRPSGIKRKRDASRELADRKNSDPTRTKVEVFTFKELVASLTSKDNEARNTLVNESLLWGDKGQRLVSNTILNDLIKKLNQFKDDHDQLVQEAANALPRLIARDQRGQSEGGLGDLFDASDYPTQEEFIAKCKFAVDLAVVPDAEHDVRAGFSPEHQERIRSALTAQHEAKVKAAMRELTTRLEDRLGRLVDRMGQYDGGKSGSFQDTLTTNIRELAGLMSGMNLTNDPAIEDARVRMIRDLCTVEAQDLRDDPDLRKRVKRDAEDILARVGNVGKSD